MLLPILFKAHDGPLVPLFPTPSDFIIITLQATHHLGIPSSSEHLHWRLLSWTTASAVLHMGGEKCGSAPKLYPPIPNPHVATEFLGQFSLDFF